MFPECQRKTDKAATLVETPLSQTYKASLLMWGQTWPVPNER